MLGWLVGGRARGAVATGSPGRLPVAAAPTTSKLAAPGTRTAERSGREGPLGRCVWFPASRRPTLVCVGAFTRRPQMVPAPERDLGISKEEGLCRVQQWGAFSAADPRRASAADPRRAEATTATLGQTDRQTGTGRQTDARTQIRSRRTGENRREAANRGEPGRTYHLNIISPTSAFSNPAREVGMGSLLGGSIRDPKRRV